MPVVNRPLRLEYERNTKIIIQGTRKITTLLRLDLGVLKK